MVKKYQIEDGGVEEELAPSRSARKRESTKIQELGERLAEMPLSKIRLLPLSKECLDALEQAHNLKNFGAKRRQLQLVGRLLREAIEENLLTTEDLENLL